MLKIVGDDLDAEEKLLKIDAMADELKAKHIDLSPRIDIAAASAKMAVLRAELRATARDANQSGGPRGLIYKLLFGDSSSSGPAGGVLGNTFGKLGGLFSGGLPAAIGAGVFGTLASGLGGLIPLLTSAGLGVGSFAALAFPQFKKISGAMQQITSDTQAYDRATTKASRSTALKHIHDDWKALSPAQRDVVHGLQDVGHEFSKLSAQQAPMLFKIFGDGMKVVKSVLPDIGMYATIAGPAIDGLVKQLGAFVKSPGFIHFISNMAANMGPAITVIGQGIGKIVGAVGNLILAFENPHMLSAVKTFFTVIAASINGTAVFVQRWVTNWQNGIHTIEHGVDNVRTFIVHAFNAIKASYQQDSRNVSNWANDVIRFFVRVGHDVEAAFNMVKAAYNRDSRDVSNWANDVVRFGARVISWFAALPGRIVSFFSSLPGRLFAIGEHIIQGLVNGIESMAGAVASAIGNVASSIPSKIASFLGIGSPSRVMYQHGLWIAQGLALGMDAGTAGVAAAAGRMAGATMPGAHGGTGAGRSYSITVNAPPPSNPADIGRQIVTMIKEFERSTGTRWRATL